MRKIYECFGVDEKKWNTYCEFWKSLSVECGFNFSINLRSADLSSADLRFADLNEADLRFADLRFADLSSADLSEADLSEADLDFSALSFKCTSFNFKADLRLAAQIAYHFCRINFSGCEEAVKAQMAIKDLANKFHRVQECGGIK
jgi:hypothetical protein